MNRNQIIDEYLHGHDVASTLASEQLQLLRRIFMVLSQKEDAEFLKHVSALMAFCTIDLTDKKGFQAHLAKITAKAFEMMTEK